MLKRKISMALAVAMGVTMLGMAGCGSSSDSSSGTSASSVSASASSSSAQSGEKVSIRILTRLSSNQPNAVAFRDRVKQFQQENPNVTVEDQSIEDEASYNTKFKTDVASGDVPELFATYGGAAFEEYAKSGVAADLSADLAADKDWSGAFLPAFENFQFSDLKGTYAVPYEFMAVALFYNKDLFKQIGAEPPKTIQEFEAVCDKFKAAGIVPMALGEKDVWRGGHLLANLIDKKLGAQENMDLGSRKAKYDDANMVDVFNLINDWNKKGYFGDKPATFDVNAEKAMFHSGKTAMHMDGSWYVPEAVASPIADKIGVVPFPYFSDKPDNQNVWMGGAGGAFCISGKAEGAKKDAALKLLKYTTSMDAFKYYQKVQKGGIFPVKLEADPSVVDKLTIDYSKLLGNAQFKAEVYSYDPLPTMTDKVRNEIQGMFAGQSPQKTAKNIQAEIDKNKK
ncbi:MAG TPA: extracellular solute-binding protein [Ruminiclostridium sp.]|nr:extracellular solute-binding protein [Ruminiclostridium sp.]